MDYLVKSYTNVNTSNYNLLATIYDVYCTYFSYFDPVPTGLGVNWITDTKAEVT
jgi:hypothetical protein